jgi:hypothetical protein
MHKLGLIGLVGVFAAALVVDSGDASACGGCFHEAPTPAKPVVESSIVSDHRMVFSISPQQTVLWDQIRYNGDPTEFVWVLPVRPGARIELSRDAWIAALDARTQPQITQPPPPQLGGFSGGGDYESSPGCGCGAMAASETAFASADNGGVSDGGAAAPPPVQVVSQEVVGPYETVIVRSDQPKALEGWLRDHGYAIPDSVVPIIDAYTTDKFDFVALRLRPGQGVRAMQPVRVVSPGADPTLPLRMVAAGVGAHVGLTLYVVSEGRYRPNNFPEGQVDDKKLVWDFSAGRSNYQELSVGVMAGGANRTWLTEFAGRELTVGGIPTAGGTSSLYDAYYGQCYGQVDTTPPVDFDAGPADPDASTDGGSDASTDAGDDAGVDAGSSTASDGGSASTPVSGLCQYQGDLCCAYDDLEVAVAGMHRQDVWITRLRADLPVAALAQDLVLEAHPDQVAVSNLHTAAAPPAAGTTASVAPRKRSPLGIGVMVVGAVMLLGRMLRRRR